MPHFCKIIQQLANCTIISPNRIVSILVKDFLPRHFPSKVIATVQQIGQSHSRIRLEESVRLIIQNTVFQVSTGGTKRGIQTSTRGRKKIIGRVTIATIVVEVEEAIEPSVGTRSRSWSEISAARSDGNVGLNFFAGGLYVFGKACDLKNRFFVSWWRNDVSMGLKNVKRIVVFLVRTTSQKFITGPLPNKSAYCACFSNL